MKNTFAVLSEILIKNNIRPSYQRIRILDYLKNGMAHPTAEEIFEGLQSEIPSLSRSTVYNTLDILIKAGIAKHIRIDGNESRFDPETCLHGHFKCVSCGSIYNFGMDISSMKTKELDGFIINETNVYFKGICKSCLLNKK